MSTSSTDNDLPRAAVDERADVALHAAPVEQSGERIGDRELDRLLHVVAQTLGIALAADLRAHPRPELVLVGAAQEIVVGAEIKAAQQPCLLFRVGDEQNGQMPRALERAHLADEA